MSETKITAIIVDDEQHARSLLTKVLEFFDHSIYVVGEANNLPGAIKLIHEWQPNVVFMDIDMPQYSGLQINDFFKDYNFKLVYITAHDNYAIDALRIKAFDYLVKPIEVEQLKACIARIEEDFLNKKKDVRASESSKTSHLEVHSLQGINYIPLEIIFYFEASAMYTIVHTETEQIIISKPLRDFAYLKAAGFYRIHRSFMVNTSKIKRFLKVESNEVEMTNGIKIPVSRSNKDEFKTYMTKSFKVE